LCEVASLISSLFSDCVIMISDQVMVPIRSAPKEVALLPDAPRGVRMVKLKLLEGSRNGADAWDMSRSN
jgi:hypothetical protein